MSQLLSRFDFGGAEFTPAILACLAIIWLMVVGCTISSLWSQGLPPKQRTIWIAAVVALPVVGLAAYLPFAIRNQQGTGLFALFSKHLVKRKP